MKTHKVCRGCGLDKSKEEYTASKFKKGRCKVCVNKQIKEWSIKNKEKVAQQCRAYEQSHKKEIRERKIKYYEDNKEEIIDKVINYISNKRATNPSFKFMTSVSSQVRYMFKSQGLSKQGVSCKTKLPFNSEELWDHLQSLFNHNDSLGPNGEIWMTKDNYGIYNKKGWNENDQSTWTWQIDHIKPHSDYPYDSMDHPNFKIVWNLSNLRPLSAKENYEDGTSRIRHKTPRKNAKSK